MSLSWVYAVISLWFLALPAYAGVTFAPLCVGDAEIAQIRAEHRASIQALIDQYGAAYVQRNYGSSDIDWLFSRAYPQLVGTLQRFPCTTYSRTYAQPSADALYGNPPFLPYLNYLDGSDVCKAGEVIPVRFFTRLSVTQWWNYALDQRGSYAVSRDNWAFYYVIPSRYFLFNKNTLDANTVTYSDGSVMPSYYGRYWRYRVCEGKPVMQTIAGNEYIAIQATGNEVELGDEYFFVGGNQINQLCGTWSDDGVHNYWQHRRLTADGLGQCDNVKFEGFPLPIPSPRGFVPMNVKVTIPTLDRHNVPCSIFTRSFSVFNRTYVIDQVCTLFDPRKWFFEVASLVFWVFSCCWIVLRA